MNIKLDNKVQCKYSGLKGIAVAKAEYINGTIKIAIQPPLDKDGKYLDLIWLDAYNLKTTY